MNSWIAHSPQNPQLASGREPDHRSKISRADRGENLFAIARPLRAPKYTRHHCDEFLPVNNLGDVAIATTTLNELGNGDDAKV
jgi:hypothetical protein